MYMYMYMYVCIFCSICMWFFTFSKKTTLSEHLKKNVWKMLLGHTLEKNTKKNEIVWQTNNLWQAKKKATRTIENWLANLSLSSLRSLSSDSPSAAISHSMSLSLSLALFVFLSVTSLRNNVRLFQLDFRFQFLLTFAFACDLFRLVWRWLCFASHFALLQFALLCFTLLCFASLCFGSFGLGKRNQQRLDRNWSRSPAGHAF